MVNPPWAGCLSASDPQSRAWFAKTQMPLLAWSSQARGFFLEGRAHPSKTDDAELVSCWYSEDNFQTLASGPMNWPKRRAFCPSTSPWLTS